MRKIAGALLLGLFVFGVTGDPVTDALFPHQGACSVCSALAGGHGLASPEAGPALCCVLTPVSAPVAHPGAQAPSFRTPAFRGRAPPSSSRS